MEIIKENIKPRKGDRTKEKILKAARALIAKHGFWNVSFQQIADQCHINQPAIFYYFPTKEDLFQAVLANVIRHSHEVTATLTSTAKTTKEKLKYHFEGNLQWAENYPEYASVLVLLYYNASFNKKLAKVYEPILLRARARIGEILEELRAQGALRGELNPEVISQLLHSALLGGIVNYLASGKKDEELKALRVCWETLFQSFVF